MPIEKKNEENREETMNAPHTHCSHCGQAHTNTETFPRECGSCGATTWENPIPVAVALTPVYVADKYVGLLGVDRAIFPTGNALVGGFAETTGTWQQELVKEVKQETGFDIPVEGIVLESAQSTPDNRRILMFAYTQPLYLESLDQITAAEGDDETHGAIIIGDDHVKAEDLIFPLHCEAAARAQAFNKAFR